MKRCKNTPVTINIILVGVILMMCLNFSALGYTVLGYFVVIRITEHTVIAEIVIKK